MTLPAVILIGSLALSFQSSTVRRFTSTVWMSYVGLELAEAAIAEASHFLQPADLFDRSLFPVVASSADPGGELVKSMVAGDLPSQLTCAYRDVLRADGTLADHMQVGFLFPDRPPVKVKVPGLARRLARDTPGILLDSDSDLLVRARPLSFRREYYMNVGGWVNWGVVQFTVDVRTRDMKGLSAHRLIVDRRFTLRPQSAEGEEILVVASQNLRTSVVQVGR
jgi:hypothetical protein